MKKMQGFTLIELMIVVAIIAILAAIAISQYQDYVIRTQVSEGASLTSGVKTAVTEFHNNYGRFANGATSNVSYGLAPPTSIVGKYVASVTVNQGDIIVDYGNDAHQQISSSVLAYSPIATQGSMNWVCDSSNGLTTVADQYLPTVCRP